MKIKILLMAVVLVGLYFSLSASAETTPEVCDEIVPTPFNFIDEMYIPMFNQDLGKLKKVTMTVVAKGWMETKIESEDPLPRTYTVLAKGMIIPTLPYLGEESFEISIDTNNGNNIFNAGPDDEPGKWNPDWAGPDYKSIPTGSSSNPVYSLPNPAVFPFETDAEMAPFIGFAGDLITIPIRTDSSFTASGGGEYVIGGDTTMGVKICVVYEYEPDTYCINGTKVGCDDEPLSGWKITLTKPDGSTVDAFTDNDGRYSFCDLKAGSYKVCEETKAGWYPEGQTCHNVQLPDPDTLDVEVPTFKNTQHFCISGYKYNVTNNVEEPLADWTITLTKPDGSTVTDTTDANGYYEFCDLASGQYKVSEELKSLWIAKSPTTVPVELYCENESVDFRNAKQPNLVCVCPFFIKNDLYGANILKVKEVAASAGILANDPAGSVVLNPESITIDPKYGTLTVEEDGSFVYDPTVATGRLYSGQYVIFKYTANNGLCDSQYPGIAKIQLRK